MDCRCTVFGYVVNCRRLATEIVVTEGCQVVIFSRHLDANGQQFWRRLIVVSPVPPVRGHFCVEKDTKITLAQTSARKRPRSLLSLFSPLVCLPPTRCESLPMVISVGSVTQFIVSSFRAHRCIASCSSLRPFCWSVQSQIKDASTLAARFKHPPRARRPTSFAPTRARHAT